ncbi:MAG: hypothetical protein JXR26_03510, partial [Balneolaceae bacterium]|nr:hypothetical protein [Balneolaceae bacterium]
MKYTKTHHQKLRNRGGYFNVVLALLFAISECSDNTPLSQKEQSGQQISQIDGKPIISISAADYYQADSDYIDKVINRLSHNGRAVVEAMNKQISLKANKLQNANSDAIFVGLSELKSTSSYKNKSTNSSNSLEDLSSHIRVLSEDGWVEEFELILEPHRGASRFANTTSAKLSAGSTWLALNPDHFYVQEDAQGNEIWPVTFPAVSVDDPDREIEVTLDRDGTLTWPSGVQNKSNSVSSENQMVYMDNMAVMDPCIDDGPGGGGTQIDPCGGGGGGTGGGSGGNIEHPAFQGINTPFLAIKTIRTDGTGDGSGGSELQMYVEPESYSGSTDFDRQWEYAFDIKYGEKGLPVTFGDGSFFEILGALLLFVTDNDLARSIEAGSIFEGYNSRTYGLDMRIYETPDVNSEL